MHIRELGVEEVPLFKALRLESMRSDPDAFGQTLEASLVITDAEWKTRLAGVLAGGGAILLAEDEGRPVGMCGVGKETGDYQAAFFWGLFVKKEARRAGVGSALLERAEAWALEHGCGVLRARVAAPNAAAISFYRNRGYERGSVAGKLRPGSDITVYAITKQLETPA